MEKSSIAQLAANAIKTFDMYCTSGQKLSYKDATPYGIAFKYLIWSKRMSFSEAARKIGYKSPQSFNYLLNHRKEEDFYEEEISFFCKKLNINEDMFIDLCKEIKRIMVANEK